MTRFRNCYEEHDDPAAVNLAAFLLTLVFLAGILILGFSGIL